MTKKPAKKKRIQKKTAVKTKVDPKKEADKKPAARSSFVDALIGKEERKDKEISHVIAPKEADYPIVGRPTVYTSALLDRAVEYLNKYKEIGHVIPQIAGLALYCGISRDTVYTWCGDKDKKEFSDIVEALMAAQEAELISMGLLGVYNPMISKLLLHKHGHSEKIEQVNTYPNGKPPERLWIIEGVKPEKDITPHRVIENKAG